MGRSLARRELQPAARPLSRAAPETPLFMKGSAWNARLWVSGFGIRGSGFGFRDPGSGFRDQGGHPCRFWITRFRVQGLGFRVSGFGFRVAGLGVRDQGAGVSY